MLCLFTFATPQFIFLVSKIIRQRHTHLTKVDTGPDIILISKAHTITEIMRFLLLLAALPAALAAKQTIQVGTQGLQFLPNTIYAQVDDTVEFLWSSPEHSVTQGMFGSPCTPTEGGVNSGLLDMVSLTREGSLKANEAEKKTRDGSFFKEEESNELEISQTKTFTITLNDTNPIWLYCAVAGHCQSGMVMVINPP